MGLPERTQDDTMVFTKFIVTGTIQVRTITNLVITLQTGGILFIVRQADQCAIKAQSYIQQRDDHRDLFTLDDRITVLFFVPVYAC